MPIEQSPLPVLPPSLARLPDPAVRQLRSSLDNLNKVYGLSVNASGFKAIGIVATEDHRVSVIQWINQNAVFPVGEMDRSRSVRFLSGADAATQTGARIEDFLAGVGDRVSLGDFAVQMQYSDPVAGDFSTIAIVGPEGIKFDTLLFGVFTSAPGQLDPYSARTDCEWWRFGWIWQSTFAEMTRGEVKMCLTVICDNAGNAIDCDTSKHCFMQIGTCDVDITNVKAAGNCCTADCAWGVATGTVTAKVKLNLGRLTVEFEGTFGSTAKGGRTLRDCCPPQPIPTPTSIRVPSDTGLDQRQLILMAANAGADPASARDIASAVLSRAGDGPATGESLRGFLIEELAARNPKWAARFATGEGTARPRNCGCT